MFDLRTAVTHIFQRARQICSADGPPDHVAKAVRDLQQKVKRQGQEVKRRAREAKRHEQQIRSLTCQVLDLQRQQLAREESETVCGDVIEGQEQDVIQGSPTNPYQHTQVIDNLSIHSARSKSHHEEAVEGSGPKTPTEYAVTKPPGVPRGQRQRILSPPAFSTFAGRSQPASSAPVNFDLFETSFMQMKKRPFDYLDDEDQNRQQLSEHFKKIRTDVGATRPETTHGTARMRNSMSIPRADPSIDSGTTFKSSARRTISDPRPTANLEHSSPGTGSHLRASEADFAFRWGLR